MRHLWKLIPYLLISCAPTAEGRRAQIERAEDQFCALRAQEKTAEDAFDLNPYEAGASGQAQ